MKKLDKLISPVVRNVLCACIAFGWILNVKYTSLLFFGESAYPQEEE